MATAAKPVLKSSSNVLWLLMTLLVFSIFINYIDRSNLSVAATNLSRELSLNSKDLGLLLGAFFWSYAALQVVAGWVVDRYNVYVGYGIAFFLWSAATALTGFASGLAMLFALRLILGVGESIAYPAYSKIIARDFPARHRGLANALIDAGSKAGPALGTLIGGLIVANYGWRSLFFVLGFGAMVWLIPWFALLPRINRMASVPASPAAHAAGPGFLEIASKRDAWGTFLVLFCGNYAWYFFLTWLPPYLEMERHFSKTMMAVYGSIPFTGIALASVFGGWLSDRLIHRGGSPTLVRKGFAITGLLMMTLVLPASMLPNQLASMALLTAGCICYGLYSSNVWAITQTLAGPSAAGKWSGMQNCTGNIAGVVAPWFTGYLVQETGQFFLAFVAVAVALVLGACSYIFLVGKVAPIAWRSSLEAGSGKTARAPE